MFWKKKQQTPWATSPLDALTDTSYVAPPPVSAPSVPASNEPAYHVGITGDGDVTLRIGNGHQWSQLTMNNAAVDTLIRMLEAAKEDEHDESNPVD